MAGSLFTGTISAANGIAAAGGLLSSLFGGGSVQQNPFMPQINSEISSANQIAGNLAGLGASAANTYSQFSPQANQAIENYARYLQQNPYTSAYSTALLNQATNGTTTAYQQARAQLQSQLASRGMSGSGLEAGGLAGLDASQAATMGTAQNNLALQEISQLGLNQQALVNLLSGQAGTAYNQASSGYGDAAGIYNNAASLYGSVGDAQMNADAAYQKQQQDALLQSFGFLAGR